MSINDKKIKWNKRRLELTQNYWLVTHCSSNWQNPFSVRCYFERPLALDLYDIWRNSFLHIKIPFFFLMSTEKFSEQLVFSVFNHVTGLWVLALCLINCEVTHIIYFLLNAEFFLLLKKSVNDTMCSIFYSNFMTTN